MIATRLRNPNFYSLDIALSKHSNGVFAKMFARIMGSAKTETETGVCSTADLEQIAELFDAGSFRWPSTGVYFGRPKGSLTRIVAYVQDQYRMNIHLRRTPFDSGGVLSAFGDAVQGCVADVVAAAVRERMNIIIIGASGVGKTRFMRSYVWNHFYNQRNPVLYIETVPEMAHTLHEHYPNGIYVSVFPTGLAPEPVSLRDAIDSAVLFARTSGVGGVVFQESHFVGTREKFEGYGAAEHIRELVSSGVPYVTTMHPSTRRPEEAIEYYRQILKEFVGETIVVSLGGDVITLLYMTGKQQMVFFEARSLNMGVEPRVDTSVVLPEGIRQILLSITTEYRNTGGRK